MFLKGGKAFLLSGFAQGSLLSCPAAHGGAGLPASAEVNQVVSSFPWRPPPPTLQRTASTEVSECLSTTPLKVDFR